MHATTWPNAAGVQLKRPEQQGRQHRVACPASHWLLHPPHLPLYPPSLLHVNPNLYRHHSPIIKIITIHSPIGREPSERPSSHRGQSLIHRHPHIPHPVLFEHFIHCQSQHQSSKSPPLKEAPSDLAVPFTSTGIQISLHSHL